MRANLRQGDHSPYSAVVNLLRHFNTNLTDLSGTSLWRVVAIRASADVTWATVVTVVSWW